MGPRHVIGDFLENGSKYVDLISVTCGDICLKEICYFQKMTEHHLAGEM
jgi:hypothetical protein